MDEDHCPQQLRRNAACSQADPGLLIGERLRSEEDVLFVATSKLKGFEGLSASEAEQVLTMLLAPYLRIPLLLGFLGTTERVGALGDERLQGVLEAAVFEPGPWRSTECPREVPKAGERDKREVSREVIPAGS